MAFSWYTWYLLAHYCHTGCQFNSRRSRGKQNDRTLKAINYQTNASISRDSRNENFNVWFDDVYQIFLFLDTALYRWNSLCVNFEILMLQRSPDIGKILFNYFIVKLA